MVKHRTQQDFKNERRREWALKTEAEITQMYANAGGHTKADLNRIRAEHLKEFMEFFGYDIPTDKECYKVGCFNGVGAT